MRLIVIFLLFISVGGYLFAQQRSGSSEELRKLLTSSGPLAVVQKLNQDKNYATSEQRFYYYTVSFDMLDDINSAISYGQKYLRNFGGIDINSSLIVLEVVLRSIYDGGLVTKFSYSLDPADLINFSNQSSNPIRSLLHYLFLDNISLKDVSSAFKFYLLANGRFEQYFEYKFLEKLRYMPNADFVSEAMKFVKSPKNLLFGKSFLIEKLIQEEKYPIAKLMIDRLENFSSNSKYHTPRLKEDLIRHSYKKPLKVGVIFPIQPSNLNYIARQLRAGLYYGLDRFRVSSSEMLLVFADVGTNVADIKKAYQDLVLKEKVSFILGPVTRLSTEELSGLVDVYGVPYLSYSISADYSKISDAAFILQKDIDSELALLSNYSRYFLCKKKAAVFYDEKDSTSRDLFVKHFKKLGGEIYNTYAIKDSKRDFLSIFAELSGRQVYQTGSSLKDTSEDKTTEETIGSGVDLILLSLPANDVGFVMNYAKAYSMENIDFAGTSSINVPSVKYANKALYPLWISDSAIRTPLNEDIFVDLWKANIADNDFEEDSIYSIYGYLTANIFSRMLKDNVFLGTSTIRVLLGSLKDFNSSVGKVNTYGKRIAVSPSLIRVLGKEASVLANFSFNAQTPNCNN